MENQQIPMIDWLNKCAIGDCREVLAHMAADGVRVQMCVTSPPYWGLRDYGTAAWEGGDDGCDHMRAEIPINAESPGVRKSTLNCGTEYALKTTAIAAAARALYRDTCGKCGARRIDQQLGLEATPEEYLENMVEVFRLVREVLADDGTIWVNMGDSYAAGGTGGYSGKSTLAGFTNPTTKGRVMNGSPRPRSAPPGLKPKDLVGMPWRLAFALQADGWYLRSDIIWAKPNPMPERVTDRPTKSHEYLFLLSKRPSYYYDADAVREPAQYGRRDWGGSDQHAAYARSVSHHPERDAGRKTPESYTQGAHPSAGRNRRDVWTIATEPCPDAHFAAFPRKLVEPCIMAGSRNGDIVLDPFMGTGTVAHVAQHLGRHWIGIDLNSEYVKMQDKRTAQQAMIL